MNKQQLEKRFWEISDDLREKGKLELAIEKYKKLVPDSQKVGFLDPLQQIGVTYMLLGELDIANEWYTRTIELAKTLDDKRSVGNTMRDQGIILIKQEKFRDAIIKLHRSYEILFELGDKRHAYASQDKLGLAKSGLGKYEEALKDIETARNKVREIDEKDADYFYYLFTMDLAKVYQQSGNTDAALKYAKEARDGCIRIGHEHKARTAQELISEMENKS